MWCQVCKFHLLIQKISTLRSDALQWILMIRLYLLQINVALASQFGQKPLLAPGLGCLFLLQLFIIVSVFHLFVVMDKLLHRETKWVNEAALLKNN